MQSVGIGSAGMKGASMDREIVVQGAIIDSWVEPSGSCSRAESRLVLQVAPRGFPRELLIVEAPARLVPDEDWLEDLGQNLCHGSPVAAVCRRSPRGGLDATRLELDR